jgi:mono/diheme cytochrome c family protein
MISNILGLLILVALAVLFGWLTTRAWRAKHALVKWPGVILAGLLTLLLALVTGVSARGLYMIYAPHNSPVHAVKVAGTPEQVKRGEHIASVVCASCHTTNGELPLTGGRNLVEETNLPLGSLYPLNLTPAGELKDWSDGEIMRAIREATHKNNRPLLMPVSALRHLSDEDTQAVVAYLRTQPGVKNDPPKSQPSLLLAVFLGAGLFPLEAAPLTGPVVAPPTGPTLEYGEYVTSWMDCRGCHGEDLQGGKPPAPVGPSLQVVKGWTQEQFVTAMRTGIDPSGHALKDPMPWKTIGKLDDVELAAMYAYLHDLPPAAATQK